MKRLFAFIALISYVMAETCERCIDKRCGNLRSDKRHNCILKCMINCDYTNHYSD